jgi:hypothetical protein
MNSGDYLHYRVGDFRTINKMQAVEAASGDTNQIHFYFADDAHAQWDWTCEPTASIDALIDRRVQQLRDSYANLVLWYSGGYDSQTILDSFVRTKTRLDKIFIYGKPYIKDPGNNEDQIASKHAHWVKNNFQPWLDIQRVDYDEQTTFDFYRKTGSDWMYNQPGFTHNFAKTSRLNTSIYHKDIRRFDKSKTCHITGVDKPRVNLRDGQWFAQMPDTAMSNHIGCDLELFYLGPESTEIYIKQVWLVIKWLEQQPECDHDFVHMIQGRQDNIEPGRRHVYYQAWNKALGRSEVLDWFAKVGYNKKYFDTYIPGDEFSIFDLDSQILKESAEKTDPTVYRSWLQGIEYIVKKYPNLWNPTNGLPTLMSRPIYIKDFTPQWQSA